MTLLRQSDQKSNEITHAGSSGMPEAVALSNMSMYRSSAEYILPVSLPKYHENTI